MNPLNEVFISFNKYEILKVIKTGKEAVVYLVKADSYYFALKEFKQNTKYSTQYEYLNIDNMKGRDKRALKNRSSRGKSLLKNIWTYNEYNILKELYDLGANVVKPYSFFENYLLLEYIGNINNEGKRLSECKFNNDEYFEIFNLILDNIYIFLENRLVHGDLSEFNILYFNKKIYIIDFPQALRIGQHKNAKFMFFMDLDNIKKFFTNKIDKQYLENSINDIYKYSENIF